MAQIPQTNVSISAINTEVASVNSNSLTTLSTNANVSGGTSTVDGNIVTNGGRVLCAVGLGANISCAREEAYKIAKEIHWEGSFFRNDIGYRAMERER